MAKRLCAAALLVLLCLLTLSGPALAVQGTGTATERAEPPTYEELRQQAGEHAEEFFHEPYEPPPFFRFFAYPLLIVGVLGSAAVLLLFLLWQPSFVRERRQRGSRRR
jgi:hypothetical protein